MKTGNLVGSPILSCSYLLEGFAQLVDYLAWRDSDIARHVCDEPLILWRNVRLYQDIALLRAPSSGPLSSLRHGSTDYPVNTTTKPLLAKVRRLLKGGLYPAGTIIGRVYLTLRVEDGLQLADFKTANFRNIRHPGDVFDSVIYGYYHSDKD